MQQCSSLKEQVQFMYCTRVDHDNNSIVMICMSPQCTQNRLMCTNCLMDHQEHRNISIMLPEAVEADILKNSSTPNQQAQMALNYYLSLRKNLLKQLDSIESLLKSIQTHSNPETEHIHRQLINTPLTQVKLNTILNTYTTLKQDQSIQSQFFHLSNTLQNYFKHLNNWLENMPTFKFSEVKCQPLSEINLAFGKPFMQSIKPSQYLVQSFRILDNCQLTAIKYAKTEGTNPLTFKLFYSTDLGSPIYTEEFSGFQMAQRGSYMVLSCFSKPIQLFKNCVYTIALTTQASEFQIYDFRQPSVPFIDPSLSIVKQPNYFNKPDNMQLILKQFISEFTLRILSWTE